MPNSYRIRTEVGTNKVLQVNLDQDYDKLEILSMSIFPNDVYTRSCADFGVICGRVFANRGLGLVNARISVFIPISEEDELNPVISTLYPYKSFEDFNEDGYKYNLLPYSQSYSGHVPVGTFPDRLDALVNPSVVEVYDKYYKFTAKTNDAGDFMIFGVPVGQYELFMQVDLSDIGEFSLAPQDLIRMGRAVESQVNGTKFKFSENYSELPQIVTLTKTIQVAPFYGEEGICQHYIVRADFDLTTESSIELKPTAVFIGSLISTENRVKLKDNCKVPKRLGNLCNLTAGPGQIECIRQTIFTDDDGRPILEEHRLENDGKLIDENGAWLVELPMNLDYQYTDEFGQRRISYDGSAGVPTRSRYRFKIKWQQSTSVAEENKRGYFLVPNIKEYGWINTTDPDDDPVYINNNIQFLTFTVGPIQEYTIILDTDALVPEYWRFDSLINVSSYEVLVDGVSRPEFQNLIPLNDLQGSTVVIRYVLTDVLAGDGYFYFDNFSVERFSLQSSYAFSLSWYDYGTQPMVQEAVDGQDRFYEFIYNKVYTVSQFLDRFSFEQAPARTLQIKNILDNSCESENYPFPTNDVIYRTDVLFTIINIFLSVFKFILIALVPIIHMLAFLWPLLAVIFGFIFIIYNLVVWVCELFGGDNCPQKIDIKVLFEDNPFKNIRLPLVLYTEDGCETCKCNSSGVDLDDTLANQIEAFAQQIDQVNISNLADFNVASFYDGVTSQNFPPLLTMLTGSYTASNPWWNRLPMIAVSSTSGLYHRWSQSLPIAERINLFNTKAKYFNNINSSGLSPGNKGWNQIKVTWKPQVNNPATKFHFDNVMIVIVDSTANLNEGDMLTFQNPNLSLDPNVNSTEGTTLLPQQITVKYANPDYSVGGFLTTTYTIADESKLGESTNCYPMDIEYFQVLQILRPSDFYRVRQDAFAAGHENGLGFVSDNKFSFPYRFFTVNNITGANADSPFVGTSNAGNLNGNDFMTEGVVPSTPQNFIRVSYMGVTANIQNPPDWMKNPPIGGGQGDNHNWEDSNGITQWASMEAVRNTQCGNSTVHQELGIDPSSSSKLNADPDPAVVENTVKILILQRGVDPNSPKIEMEIDYSRIFGMDYNNSIYGSGANLGGLNNNRYAKYRGLYRMNIPIQAGGNDTGPGENWTSDNKTGLLLPRHNEITDNRSNFSSTWSNVHFPSYVYDYGNDFISFSSVSLKYYSALQSDTYSNSNWAEGLDVGGTVQQGLGLAYIPLPVATVNGGAPFGGGTYNLFASTLVKGNTGGDTSPVKFKIRSTCQEGSGCCRLSDGNGNNWGCGDMAGIMWTINLFYHVWVDNRNYNNTGGYWGSEYVEGASLMTIRKDFRTPDCSTAGVHVDCVENNNADNDYCTNRDGWTRINLGGGYNCNLIGAQSFDSCRDETIDLGNLRIIPEQSAYISPTYATFKNPDADFYTTSCLCTYSNKANIVIRTDRLPTSDTVQKNNKGNGYLLHQNAGFSMYLYSAACVNLAFGGGEITLPQVGSEDVNNDNLPSEFQDVANSLTSCSDAVDLNSYLVDDNPASPTYGTPRIGQEDPYSRIDANVGKDYVWFLRGSGCYNLISKPILSLIGKDINGDPFGRRYSDIRIIVEWVQRLKLNFALCFNVLSHTFSNNWINGTLFAFTFKNTTYFDSNNNPYREYCKRNIYFNETLKSYFYRSSPYDGNSLNFVGRPSSNVNNTNVPRGNLKNLLYPTTILDMGPKNQFIQELVYSDDYDGYIVDKIPSTTFKDVTDILNLFVLSRIINVKFINMLIPTTLFQGGNEGGSDPSIGAFFANLRWNNGEIYRNYLLPGLIDADYAQTIAIQSQYGVYEYSTDTYGPSGIFFGRYNLDTVRVNPETGAIETPPASETSGAGAVFGLFFSANTQNIDYISPRRTIFNNTTAVTPPDYLNDFSLIPTFSQNVPYYRWNISYNSSNTIFGYQSNNSVTTNTGTFPYSRYQQFDRADTASQYFAPSGNRIRNYLSYPINFVSSVDASGNTIYTPTSLLPPTTVNPITLGTPFYFYFGLKIGASAMDKFITKYVDTTIIND